jgi:probable blue pigment (indigoidine) exporter
MIKAKEFQWMAAGLLFSIFWASASTATKIGLEDAQPLVIASTRFAVAAFIMLFYAHFVKGERLPTSKEWKSIAIYGLLNITVYLGLYVIAMQEVTASIGALATATNPLFISLISVFFLNTKLTWKLALSLFICICGVICASWPAFGDATVTTKGLFLLLLSMISYSLGAIYISRKKWDNLSIITINGWQTFLGGLFLLPISLYFFNPAANHFTFRLSAGILWLAIPVSIFASQLWLWLLKINPVKAGFWLFLCPLFGALIAAVLVNDEISIYTWIGILLVIGGLIVARK